MNEQHFTLTAGTDEQLALIATQRNGAIRDLTGATLAFKLYGHRGKVVKELSGTITSASDGTYTVDIADTDTIDLQGRYTYLVQATISGSVYGVSRGRITLRKGHPSE